MNRLISTRFNSICRIVDMLGLYFGDNIEFERINENRVTKKESKPQYSLHVQTQWRFRKDNKIFLASRDIYTPSNPNVDKNWQYDLHGRPHEQSSIFDVQKEAFEKVMCGSFVTNLSVSEFGDISIVFSNGVVFEVFVSASVQDEEWRFFHIDDTEHTVFYDLPELPSPTEINKNGLPVH